MTRPSAVPDDKGTAAATRPLVVAVDRTLLRSDLTHEALLAYLKPNPLRLPMVLGWLWRGRGYVKRQLAERASIDIDTLPVNASLADWIEAEAAAGRRVFLASSGNSFLVDHLKKRFPFVAGTIAAEDLPDALARRFPEGFDYAGSSLADLDVWRRASSAVLVGVSPRIERRAAALVPISMRIPGPSRFAGLLAGLRLHQLAKNLLVFVPLVLGGDLDQIGPWLSTVAAFLALGLVSSSTYLINDMLDVADDRRHWSKRERPIAKGLLRVSSASVYAGAGLAAGLAVAAWVSWPTLAVLVAYVGLTFSYSLGLKRLPVVDGLVLATLYTLRLALGMVAAAAAASAWLFVFSMFLFTSLSLAKRYTELDRSRAAPGGRMNGRGYRTEDAPLLLAIGTAAGLGAVVTMIFYIIEDAFKQSFGGSPLSLWGFPPLIFLIVCRVWLVTVRGEMDDDPVKFMLRDRPSQFLVAALAVCFAVAWL